MDSGRGINRTGAAAAILGAIALLAILALVFDLGPFAEDELSTPEFLAMGDEICNQAHEEFIDLQSNAPRTPDEAVSLMESLIAIAEDERDALRDLDVPPSLSTRVDEYLAEREKGIDVLRIGLESARDEDPEAYEAAQARLEKSQRKRELAARDVGFNECSAPLDPS